MQEHSLLIMKPNSSQWGRWYQPSLSVSVSSFLSFLLRAFSVGCLPTPSHEEMCYYGGDGMILKGENVAWFKSTPGSYEMKSFISDNC